MENEIFLLNKVGLTETEAKVYLTLLQHGSMSGYETSKLAGVSRSKIYVVLECLISKGFVLYTQLEKNNKYSATPFKEVASRVENDTKDTLNQLTTQLDIFPKTTNMDDIWHIRSCKNVFAKCKDIIKHTKKELLLQIWYDDLFYIIDDLIELENKEVNIGIVIFNLNDNTVPLKKYYKHKVTNEKKIEMGGRWITLVSDNNEVVFGQIINDSIAEVIWTESIPMITLSAEYIRHDIYFYKCVEELHDEMKNKFGDNYEDIRNIF